MSYREYITNKAIRISKFILMAFAILVGLLAYNLGKEHLHFYSNGSNTFDRLISVFCVIITFCVSWEYYKDDYLRLISGTALLLCVNNLLDELFFNPFNFGLNEKSFAIILGINFIYNIVKILDNGYKATERE